MPTLVLLLSVSADGPWKLITILPMMALSVPVIRLSIDLGDVEIGEDQVALVVTKEGRDTSGIGDGEGDLRADRIINVQSDVSPDNARYSLISEMGFMISLIPPQTGAVRKPGDVVGKPRGRLGTPQRPKVTVAR